MLNQTYDNEADALYIRLRTGVVARTDEIDPLTLVDVDATGGALGIEVLRPARDWPVTAIITQYGIEGQDRALLEAMYPRFGGSGARVSFAAPAQDVSADARLLATA